MVITRVIASSAFLRIMTSSRSLGCCRSKTWQITSRIGACQACLHLMFLFTDVCACEIRRREVTEACWCACADGIAPSKVSTSDDACDDHFLISAKSETLLSRPLSASMYTNFAQLKVSDSKVRNFGLGQAYRSPDS